MMNDAPTASRYDAAFRERLIAIRESLKWTQADMAQALGISLDRYKKYEIRSKFPPYLYEKLALVTHRELYYIVTGRNVRVLHPVAAAE